MAQQPQAQVELLQWTITIAAGLVGVLVGAWLSGRQQRSRGRLAFLEQQLRDFYSPMLGLRNEIRMRSELRLKLQTESEAAWKELAEQARGGGVAALERLSTDRGPAFKELIEYDNVQFEHELLPAYRKMVSLFRDNYWLADSDTHAFYQGLLQFVELWERWLAGAVPYEVVDRVGLNEGSLQPFYKHLQDKNDALRSKIASGNP
ncbi:MAG: hypothetical protein LLG08_03555 [Actinomycetia bacterium]|nr:hypothetical protein [Actinomycetes bacterium]